ncbi:uncharacterized protein MYCFIDRAFT_30457 [Pseudocercospora fijiensis CIRAD86]|uniref:Capsule polysaccharide biosynthesis protein n=1 Tax=Pseudocercospora fijiensis (strain CIRAD86) TaxID=383855 RepID=M2ZSR1_PSEFD|nr:uncharacterized protein MYCFIDRAFT_30457 [Pseudocercospora fijiensis CIRAD86]EME82054.1 hypothetical protein MYCFIDRAFT_30457 [Pseudocercospora fijiensis CIRAD86]
MSRPNVQIPPEFASALKAFSPKDARSDAEILATLTQHAPVASEKNIWAFWDKGIDKMPGWCQRNVYDWVRICGDGSDTPEPWTIRVLDAIPSSPNYALNFVTPDQVPQSFVQGAMQGPYTGPHSADFLRGALLYNHGGVFMDVGNILFRHLDHIAWNTLTSSTSPYRIAVPIMYDQVISNSFVMSRKHDPFIKTWHELFTHFWKGRKDHKGIMTDPLLAFAANLNFEDSRQSDFHWDFNVDPATVFEYISQVLAFLRLTMLNSPLPGGGETCAEYWQTHIFCFDSLQECWGAESVIGFKGQDFYDALSTRTDIDVESEEYRKASNLVWRLLAKSSIQKITHGKHLTVSKHLGALWDENEGRDVEPGTFAELLRYGCTHFEQTRTEIVRMEAAPVKELMDKGVFEP